MARGLDLPIGTRKTLEHMARVALEGSSDPFVRKNAKAIVQTYKVQEGALLYVLFPLEVRALFEYAQGTHPTLGGLQNERNPRSAETLRTPRLTEQHKGGDVEDVMVWLAAHLMALKYGPIRFVVIAADKHSPDEFSHVYIHLATPEGPIVEDGRHWLSLDPVVDEPMGWEYQEPTLKAFLEIPS